MALTMHTVTLQTTEPDTTTPLDGTWKLTVNTQAGTLTNLETGGLAVGERDQETVAGVTVFTLPAIPQTNVAPADASYVLHFTPFDKRRGRIRTAPFQLDGNKLLKDLFTDSGLPITPVLVAEATAARDAALAAQTAAEAAAAAATAPTAAQLAAVDADPASALRVQQDARLASTYTPLPKPGKNPLTGWYHVDGYGADPTGVANSDAAWTAVMAAANATGGIVYAPGKYAVSTGVITFAGDNVHIAGSAMGGSRITATGTGVAIDFDPAAVRRNCGVDHMHVLCPTAGATAYRLRNSYRGTNVRSKFQAQTGTTSIAVDVQGSLTTSTYFNTFWDCEAVGSLDALRADNNVGGLRWVGGVLEGQGRSFYMPATTNPTGTCVLENVGIQSSGANTGGVVVEFGTAAGNPAVTTANYNAISNCRIETDAAGTILFHPNAYHNFIHGGTMSGTVQVTDNSAPSGPHNSVYVPGGSQNPGKFNWPMYVKTLTSGTLTTSPGTAESLEITKAYIKVLSTGADMQMDLRSKGATGVSVNRYTNDGTKGLNVYSGGATPANRATIGWNTAYLAFPALNSAFLQGMKSGQSQYNFQILDDGKISWGDGVAAGYDTNLYRSGANTLKTDDSLEIAGNLAVTGTVTAPVGMNTQTGASYTLVLADAGKAVEMNNAAANTLTIPPSSSVAFPVGTVLEVAQLGVGQTTIAAGAGVTLRAPSGAKLTGQYAAASLRKRATDEWILSGSLTT